MIKLTKKLDEKDLMESTKIIYQANENTQKESTAIDVVVESQRDEWDENYPYVFIAVLTATQGLDLMVEQVETNQALP